MELELELGWRIGLARGRVGAWERGSVGLDGRKTARVSEGHERLRFSDLSFSVTHPLRRLCFHLPTGGLMHRAGPAPQFSVT